ncbi:MAG: NAD(P)-binding domain-containing protein [Chloroflexi bacterium]|nr:NAD(P)-binding domain-containing protein [Chloroflexota bacterium]
MEDAIVVGAGQAGLGVSRVLVQRGVPHVVLERGRVGETWRTQRWDSFALNTPNWLNRMPGDEEDVEPRDGFIGLRPWIERMDAYAATHALPVRTGSDVTRVERHGDGTFSVQVRTGHATHETLRARSVVVASGIQRVSRVPRIARSLPLLETLSIHTAHYTSPGQLPPGGVLVVGSGQSGTQIAEELVRAGRTVHLSASRVARVRRRYRGRDILEWLASDGFFEQRAEQLPDPSMSRAAQPITSGLGRYGHTISLQWLESLGVHLCGRLRDVSGGHIAFEDDLAASIRFGDASSAAVNAQVAAMIADRDLDASLPPLEPDPADEPHPAPDAVHSPPSLDLDAAGIGTVIWSTGFGGRFDYLEPDVLDERGTPRHDGVRTDVPGLYVIGFPWLTCRKSGLVSGILDDARLVADALTGHLVA